MAFHPMACIRADVLLPHGDNFLETINPIARRFKAALVAMTTGARNQNGGFAHL